MKLLFDANLSPALVKALAADYPDCVHVRDVGLLSASDAEIWTHAKSGEFPHWASHAANDSRTTQKPRRLLRTFSRLSAAKTRRRFKPSCFVELVLTFPTPLALQPWLARRRMPIRPSLKSSRTTPPALSTDLGRFIDQRFLEAATPVLDKTNGHIAAVRAEGESLSALLRKSCSYADSKLKAHDKSRGWQEFINWAEHSA